MKRLTMVARCGDLKAPATSSTYTLIGEDYSFEKMSGADIVKAVKAKKIEVTNLGITDKGLTGTNGSLKNYTTFDAAGNMVSQPRAVVLNRVETEKGLIGYTIYNMYGVLQEVNVAQLAELANAGLVANGKIRHTKQGDMVSSISGMYPLRIHKIGETVDTSLAVGITFMGAALHGKHSIKYAGVKVNCKNAAGITKVYEGLDKANKKLISEIQSITGTDETASMSLRRMDSTAVYAVYPLEVAFKLIAKANNKAELTLNNKLYIACTDYEDDKTESTVLVSADKKIAGKNSGNAKTDKAVKAYTEKILEKLSGVTLGK